jgi:putative membrane protein
MRRVALALLAAISSCAFAHEVGQLAPPPLWYAWNRDWWLWLLIPFSGWLYARGVRRLWAAAEPGAGISAMQVAAFALGWLALIVALLSPLDVLSAQLFSAHMVQHELLMIVAAPLLILGHPLGPFIWALPPRWRKPAADLCRELGLQRAVRWLTRPLIAWIVGALALWLWHIPGWFNAALRSEAVHVLQHTCFFVSALLFWWSLFQRRTQTARYGAGVFNLFTTGVHTAFLGALLTFSKAPWYSAYGAAAQGWNLTPLEDQQLGGLIMWIPGGLIYLAAALWLMAMWMSAGAAGTERLQQAIDVRSRSPRRAG